PLRRVIRRRITRSGWTTGNAGGSIRICCSRVSGPTSTGLQYILPEDDVFPAEEQPLPAATSPTAESPGYIPESNPDEDPKEDNEDPEEDPADYPTDHNNEEKEKPSRDDADEEDEEQDGDDDDEEEEHPASADSIPPLPALRSNTPPDSYSAASYFGGVTAAVDVVYNDEELRLNLDLLEERCEPVAIREAKAKLKMTKYYNARVRGVTFRSGDFIYRSNDASHAVNGGKLSPKWEGPYEVKEKLGDGAYKLRSANGTVLPRTWNIANLKKCYL
nr:reverse transcriptase domain-containing protein [Tanacetum cinerariifolium]